MRCRTLSVYLCSLDSSLRVDLPHPKFPFEDHLFLSSVYWRTRQEIWTIQTQLFLSYEQNFQVSPNLIITTINPEVSEYCECCGGMSAAGIWWSTSITDLMSSSKLHYCLHKSSWEIRHLENICHEWIFTVNMKKSVILNNIQLLNPCNPRQMTTLGWWWYVRWVEWWVLRPHWVRLCCWDEVLV